ncbi:MAG TPA: hypothetical protein PK586_15690 [Casimicrobium sp.]|nr:hypothetical protein [Casimicrobium sp.]
MNALESSLSSGGRVRAIQYTRKATFKVPSGAQTAIITSVVTPLAGGWLVRRDDWRDRFNQALVYQERYLMYRGLFGGHVQFREIAPFFHEIFGSLGWFNDEVQSQTLSLSGNFPADPNSLLSVSQKRQSDTDGQSISPKAIPYERNIQCKPDGIVDAQSIHTSLHGARHVIACEVMSTNGAPSRKNRLVHLEEFGIFMILESQVDRTTAEPSSSFTLESLETLGK